MKPHDQFKYIRPDEVAECWDGVLSSGDLYERLWDLMTEAKPIPNLEDSGPHDHVGHENLASHWHKLSEEHQARLNELAEKQDAEHATWEAEWQKKYGKE